MAERHAPGGHEEDAREEADGQAAQARGPSGARGGGEEALRRESEEGDGERRHSPEGSAGLLSLCRLNSANKPLIDSLQVGVHYAF